MSGGRWMAYCGPEGLDDLGMALASLGVESWERAATADGLRAAAAASEGLNVAVGDGCAEVAPVNLAAAVVRDGRAGRVVLVHRDASGSLRSRAHRAGIDLVVDPAELVVAAAAEGGSSSLSDGGPVSVSKTSAAAAPERGVAPIVTFCSGRGGVGKTSIVAVAAAVAASWGMTVGVVDLDLSCGNAAMPLGVARTSDLALLKGDASASTALLDRLGVAGEGGVRLWGPCDRPESAELVGPAAAAVLAHATRCCDLVLVDTSTTFTDAVAQAAQMADRLVLVADGRPGSTYATARMAGLAVRLGVARTRIVRVENRANPRSKPGPVRGRAEVGLEAARVHRVFDGGGEVPDYLSEGLAGRLAEVGSPFAVSVAAMLARLLDEVGRLPDVEAASRALGDEGRGLRRRLFMGKREVG